MKRLELDLIESVKKRLSLSCGECNGCCIPFQIDEIKKKDDTRCVYLQSSEEGCCSIYQNRPKTCKDFECEWLRGKIERGQLRYRPDNLGLVVTIMTYPPFNGILGIFRVIKNQRLTRLAQQYLRRLEEERLFFFEEKLYGPQKAIDVWRKKWNVK